MAVKSQRARPFAVRSALVGFLLGALVAGLAVVLAAPSFLRHRGDLPLERAFAEIAKEVAIPRSASDLRPPAPLNDRRSLARGREAYTGSCAVCHGASGDGRGLFGSGLYPDATDLRAHDTQEKSDGQLFWIVKNGLSFGGMPAFAEQYQDDAIWAVVGYIRALGQGGAPATPLSIAAPTADELAIADPAADDPAARGAAVYLAQGCHLCHGARGVAPGDLALGSNRRGLGSTLELAHALREPPAGMPRYPPTEVADDELRNVLAYLATFPSGGAARRGG